ncbi:MAG: ImmA/IrrE family metallo-endopeptidase [bacterium]|nr:ImmA/IrrE family metallo-endopeptidase [bacterium]
MTNRLQSTSKLAISNLHTEAKRAAQEIVDRLYITKPDQLDLVAIAATLGVYSREDILVGSEARIQIGRKSALVTIKSDIAEEGKKRFGLAHELGHYVLHRDKAQSRRCTEEDFLTWYRSTSDEPQANVFAAELLMPQKLFHPACSACRLNFESIAALSETFKTSLTATAIRYVELSSQPCALVSSRSGKIAWSCSSDSFHHVIISFGTNCESSSYAGEYFSDGIRPTGKPRSVPPIVWLETPDLVRGYRLYEDAICMPRYECVLTLLWIAR